MLTKNRTLYYAIFLTALFCSGNLAAGEMELRSNDVRLFASDEDRYPTIRFFDKGGKSTSMITSHSETNLKIKGSESVVYDHKHLSIYSADEKGKMRGVLDITFGNAREQIQVENADLVMKGKESSLIIRSPGGKYFKILVGEDGTLSTERFSTVIRANRVLAN